MSTSASGLRLKDLRSIQRTVVREGGMDLVRTRLFAPAQRLPLIVEPSQPQVDLAGWIGANRAWINQQLNEHGGTLFRGFPPRDAAGFEALALALSGETVEYTYRSTPRTRVQNRVYTSTEYPADQTIPMHNENSYASMWPLIIWFYCAQPASSGGETPIADSRQVFRLIAPEVRERFARKRVMYVRNYSAGVDLPWQTVFQTDDRDEVETFCRQAAISWEWRGADRLRTWQVMDAVAQHPKTGEMVWFNQAHLFHVASLAPDVRDSMLAAFGEENLPRHARYGDGTPIEAEALDEVRRAYQQSTVAFPWEAGDALLLDNMSTAHGRYPFTGPRKILVAMAEPVQAPARTA